MNQKPQAKLIAVILILFYIFLFCLTLQHSYAYLDPDLGWHLKTGEEITQNGSVPHINTVDYTLLGERWVDHEWLTNLMMYKVVNNYSYLPLHILFALLPVIALIIFHRFIKKELLPNLNPLLLIIMSLFSLIAIAPHLGLRVQEITVFNLLLLTLILYYYNKNKKIRILFWLPPLFCLWANTHGGFLIGLAVLALFAGVKILEYILSKTKKVNWIDFSKTLSPREIGFFIYFSFLSLIATLITPYGSELYSFFFGTYTNTFYMAHIAEWLPQWAWPFMYWQFIYLTLSLLMLIITFHQIKKRISTWKLELWPIVSILVFLFLAISSRRHFPLFFVMTFPWLIVSLTKYLDIKGETLNFKNKLITRLVAGFVILTLLSGTANAFLATKFHNDPFRFFCENKYDEKHPLNLYPCAGKKFLQDNPQYGELKLLNHFGWGGWLIWNWPTKQLFIDGRMPQANYRNWSILEEYFEFSDAQKIPAKIAEHQIEMIWLPKREKPKKLSWIEKYFLLINESDLNKKRAENPLLDFAETSPFWKLVYEDEISVIYVKR
jgi:hypothetical protein